MASSVSSPAPKEDAEKLPRDLPLPSPEPQMERSLVHRPVVIDLTLDDDDDHDDIQVVDLTRGDHTTANVKAEPEEQPTLFGNTEDIQQTYERAPTHGVPKASVKTSQQLTTAESSLVTGPPQSDSIQASANTEYDLEAQLQSLHDFLNIHANGNAEADDAGHPGDFPSIQTGYAGIDSEEEDAEHAAAFYVLNQEYEAKQAAGTLDMEGEVKFHQAKEDESRRRRVLQRKRAYHEEQSMFFPENEDTELTALSSAPTFAEANSNPRKKPRIASSGRSAAASAANVGAESSSEEGRPAKQRGGRRGQTGKKAMSSKTRVPKPRERKVGQKVSQKGGRGGGRARRPEGMLNLPSLFVNDIVGNSRRNQGRGQQPGFSTKNKATALKELLSSIPKSHRKGFAATTKELDLACERFSHRGKGSMHADGAGRWRLKGMTSSLYHYQLLGAGWMRERETGDSYPFGGLLADTMGYGKTIMTLCNIVEGRPKANWKNKTTLIVCPSSLCEQWLEEIKKHVEPRVLGEVIILRGESRVHSADPVRSLTNCAIVITSYHEVMKNYPKCEPPKHLTQEESKQKWWAEYYEENKGPLLRIAFHRIVLDEGHLIKNHEARTSKACRSLTAKYRWILSGTPLQNGLEELGPFLMFLGVCGAATYDQFKENYCKRNEKCMQRVDALLREIMVRRTGSDEMFGQPILSLPALRHDTIIIEFNPTEKAVYQIVRAHFIERINNWSASGLLQKNKGSMWTMLLRLRQMCAHVLIIAPILKDLLDSEDLEKLWRLTDRETLPSDDAVGPGTVTVLRKMLAKTQAISEPHSIKDADANIQPSSEQEAPTSATAQGVFEEPNTFTGPNAPGGVKFTFRKYLRKLHEDGSWAEIADRTLCHRCREPPEEPRLTKPCMHLYCQECVGALFAEALVQKIERPVCLECSMAIETTERLRGEAEMGMNLDDPASQPSHMRIKRKGSAESDETGMNWIDAPGAPLLSSKSQAVTSTIISWLSKDPSTKIIIFSLFLPMIQVFRKICQRQGWGCCMYVGNMDQKQRQKSIKAFRDDENKSILLASMKAGGLGLNLTMASKCCVIDPWWNESVEDQAWSRVFRIGQEKNVEVKRFVVKDSIDTQLMLTMQERKTKEISRVIGDRRPDKNMTVQELMKLFGPVQIDPATGAPQVDEDEDAGDEFVFAEDQYIQDDSDAEVSTITPARPW